MNFIEIEKSIKNEEWSMIDLHSHSHYEIYLLKEGNRTFFLSNALYHLTAPVLIIIPPHVLHKTEGSAFVRYNVNVSEQYLDEFQKHVLEEKALSVIKLNDEQNRNFAEIFDSMKKIRPHQKFSDSIMKTLFSYSTFLLNNLSSETLSSNVSEEKSVPPLILKVIEFLNLRYSEKLTLSYISEKFYISKGTLIYNFNKHLKCSPIDYLLSIRIAKAKEFLQRTHKSINEISELCGFSSANYFGLIFKQKEKLSPLAYRKHQQNKA
ncbi:MAG: helix-turn-helix transcriptional regulator [Clostridia bacterium]|nr:helix-turn-helix transcriptional regulator [Clostridia bacterium]